MCDSGALFYDLDLEVKCHLFPMVDQNKYFVNIKNQCPVQ